MSDQAANHIDQLEKRLASLHDLPEAAPQQPPVGPFFVRHPEAIGRRA